MTRALVIVGCGGFGREVWAIVEALRAAGEPWTVEGFVDDSPSEDDLDRIRALGSNVVGSVADLRVRQKPYSAVIAVGSPPARLRIHAALADSPVDYPRIVHPDSTVGQPSVLGAGVVIAPGARLSTNIRVGIHVHIDQNVTVGHDTTIGNFVRLNPHACISGSVKIGANALIGAGGIVLQGLKIGSDSTVGAGACVTHDVGPRTTVVGIPARQFRHHEGQARMHTC